MKPLSVAVVGAGSFGRNHVRAISEIEGVRLAAVVDVDTGRAHALADTHQAAVAHMDELPQLVDCAIVATPTVTHAETATRLLNAGLDVLVEKPIAHSADEGDRLARLAQERGRILQIGHLERFNPAITAVSQVLSVPLFFEIHRLSVFTPRSLDIDVVLDLMIHDLDIVLSFTRELPVEIRAAGISVLSPLVDIANVRLAFASGCVANLTASRVSTEKVRKLRLFQPGEYISVDYQRQDAVRLAVRKNEPNPQIDFRPLPVTPGEPLKLELESFFSAIRTHSEPKVTAFQAANALRVAEAILAKIKEHADLVADTIRRRFVP